MGFFLVFGGGDLVWHHRSVLWFLHIPLKCSLDPRGSSWSLGWPKQDGVALLLRGGRLAKVGIQEGLGRSSTG